MSRRIAPAEAIENWNREMATGTTTESVVTPNDNDNDYDRFIIQQIERTQRQVKVTELATLVLMLAVGVLAFFLLITIVDHWIVGLGFWGRTAALLLLAASTIGFLATRVIPYLVRTINPIYAARAIEMSSPSTKNGLINFMLLRDHPDRVRAAVFEAVQKRAAVDLSDVEVDLAVDRTRMIWFGYAFAILVTIAGAYKILSPKDPIATVARVVTPWEQIARPSRVRIDQVSPGDTTVYRGQSIEISASVFGVDDQDPISVIYSTEDGQVVDSTLTMTHDGGSTYVATLGADGGMQQPTLYRIQGGDAESIEYRIDVKEAPSIEVARVDYDFPRYTELPAESTNIGDIRAIEGTKVTITAKSNQPISSAYIELVVGSAQSADVEESKATRSEVTHSSPQFRTLRMRHSGQTATATFVLKLQADRKTPEHSSYQVRFSNEHGERNDRPVLHEIEVTPDLVPLVDILSPKDRDIEVPANRFVDFEVRGVDPDYKLSSLTVEAATDGINILKSNLLEKQESGQVIRTFRFRPKSLALKPGMSALVWAVAEDNRCSPKTGQPESNKVRTENFRIRVVAPERFESEPDEENQEPDPNRKKDDRNEDSGGENGENGGGGVNSAADNDPSASQSDQEQDQSGTGSPSENDSDQDSESNNNQAGGEGQSTDTASSESDSTDSESTNANSNNNESRNDSSSESGDPSNDGKRNSNGSDSAGTESANDEPVASDGTNDPDAFERILNHMRENGKDPESQAGDQPNSESDSANDPSDSGPNEGDPDTTDGNSGDEKSTDDLGGQDNPQNGLDNNPDGKGNQDNQQDAEANQQPNRNGDGDKSDDVNDDDAGGDSSGTNNEKDSDQTNRSEGNVGDDPGDARQDGTRSDEPNPTGKDHDRPKGSEQKDGDPKDADPKGGDPKGDAQPSDNADQQSESDHTDPNGKKPGQRDTNQKSDDGKSGEHPESQNGEPSGDSNDDASTESQTPDNSGSRSGPDAATDESSTTPPAGNDDVPSGTPAENSAGGENESPKQSNGEPREVKGQDDPNLEYARKATDMAIEYLKDKKDNRDLLKDLGWTESDADAFIKRWQDLQKQSAGSDNASRVKRDWNDSLKSLGLKPKSATKTSSGKNRRRDVRSISSDGGGRSRPPKSYAEQFRAYLKESDSED